MSKIQESLLAAHALEAERLQDRHRAELRRVQAELEARNHEASVRQRNTHELEMKRLLRDNDRLQSQLMRVTGGGSAQLLLRDPVAEREAPSAMFRSSGARSSSGAF